MGHTQKLGQQERRVLAVRITERIGRGEEPSANRAFTPGRPSDCQTAGMFVIEPEEQRPPPRERSGKWHAPRGLWGYWLLTSAVHPRLPPRLAILQQGADRPYVNFGLISI